jgi:hypothetical protein
MATFPRSQPLGPIQTGDQSLVSDVPQFKAGAAGAAIGEGLQSIGTLGLRLSQEVRKANDSRAFIEFDTDSELTLNNISTAITQERDETKWEGIAQQQLGALQKKYADRKISSDARLRLDGAFAKFSSRAITDIQKRGFIQAGENVVTAARTRLEMLAKNGAPDEDIDTVVSAIGNAMGEPQKEALAFEYKQRAQSSAWNITTNNAKFLATERGDLEGALALIDAGSESEDVKNLTRVAIKDLHERTVETKANKADAERYGGYMNRIANSEPKAAILADIEKEIQAGNVSQRNLDTFARLKLSLKNEIGADPDKLQNFINEKVLPYDPAQDPTGKNLYELQVAAMELSPNDAQAKWMSGLIAGAEERHKTPESRVAAALHLESRKLLADFGDKSALTADKDPSVLQTLQKPYALEHWGIDSVTADKIRKLTKTSPSEAIALFRETSNERKAVRMDKNGKLITDDGLEYRKAGGVDFAPSVINPDEIAKLSPTDIQAFERAVANKSFITTDEGEQREAAMIKAQLQGELDDWAESFRKQEKRNPTKDDYLNKMRSLTEPYEDSELWKPSLPDIQMPKKTNARSPEPNRYTVEPDGSFSGLASSYGYEGDADNGYNSVGFKRGEQPWYGEAPTIALAPSVAENLGVSLPRRTKDGWDLSNSYVEIEANGQKTRAIYDENGMYIVAASKNKLVDLTPEASAALGLPIKSNHPVKVRKPNG